MPRKIVQFHFLLFVRKILLTGHKNVSKLKIYQTTTICVSNTSMND